VICVKEGERQGRNIIQLLKTRGWLWFYEILFYGFEEHNNALLRRFDKSQKLQCPADRHRLKHRTEKDPPQDGP